MSEPTPDEIQLEEERGIAAALFFVVSNAERKWPVLDDVKEIHRLLFEESHSTMAGKFRQDAYWPQYIRFSVPRWNNVPICMLRLEELMERAKTECDALIENNEARVIEWTARIHHRFERIHPFEDGNGRTGRALAVWMLLFYNLPALDVTPETRMDYINALDAADDGLKTDDLLHSDVWPHQTDALQPLIDFIWEALSKEL